jgi:hypothetical protein
MYFQSGTVFPAVFPAWSPKVGELVGAGRWPEPLQASSLPWLGIVLAVNDPSAWQNSIAFGQNPSQEAIDAHVEAYQSQWLIKNAFPVLWNFGERGCKVFWETSDQRYGKYCLRPYHEDVARWRLELLLQTPKKALLAA